MDKLKMHTSNKADENYEKLAAMFPNAITETIDENGEVVRAIDKDVLMQEISCKVVEGREERYQFTWPDKKKSVLLANAPVAKTLRPCREESVEFDNTENLYIEGDNLEVLKLLQETYLGKIKMIYIDPPYNTGNDFVYDDDFAQSSEEYIAISSQYDDEGNRLVQNTESNGRFHTDWLNMMYPRIKIAKDLLAEDGVIFISIDENEVYNMQKICNEIFGEQNYAATFIWTKTSTPPSLSYKCRKTVEYVLAYEKELGPVKYFGDYLDGGDVPFLNTGNPMKKITFPPHSINLKFINNGTISAGQKEKVYIHCDMMISDNWNTNEVEISGEFKWEQATVNKEIDAGTYFVIKSDKFSIRFQRMDLGNAYKTPTNMLNIELNKEQGVGTNESAVKELKELGLDKCFSYPKPISLLNQLIKMVCKTASEALVMDFFSGSATTAHALMQLNTEDDGNRKFIMVQVPEKTDEKSEANKTGYDNICEIGKERIRRAGTKIKEENPKAKFDAGFRVLKCDSSNMKEVYYNPMEYQATLFDSLADNIKEDRTPEDLLFQVMLDLGVELSSSIEETEVLGKKVFNVANGFLIACFDENVSEDVVTEVAKKKPYYFVMRDNSMANDSVATNFDQLFATYSADTIRKVL